MFKLLNKKKNNKGFTLVELVIAIAILALLVGLAPQYTKYVEKSRKAADADNLEEMVKAVQVYEADTESAALTAGTYTITMTTTQNTAVSDKLIPAMKEYVPDYATKKLKSKKWGKDGLKATITVGDDGKISVAYEPKALSDYIGVAATTATTNP